MEAETLATGATSVPSSPVDDQTYNILQALTSTLEAIEAYEAYELTDEDGLFTRLLEDERAHADTLLEALRGHISQRAA